MNTMIKHVEKKVKYNKYNLKFKTTSGVFALGKLSRYHIGKILEISR